MSVSMDRLDTTVGVIDGSSTVISAGLGNLATVVSCTSDTAAGIVGVGCSVMLTDLGIFR